MKRFLFCPLGGYGYVYPMIGTALEVQRRGHKVAFATDVSFEPVLTRAGIERIPRTERDGSSFGVESWFWPLAIALQVKHLEYALRIFMPDVIVGHQLTLGPLIASERFGIPIGILGFAAYLWPSKQLLHRTPVSVRERRQMWRFNEVAQMYAEIRRQYRLPPQVMSCVDTPMLGQSFAVQSVKSLQPDAEFLPSQVHLVGSCLWEPAGTDSEISEWIARANAADEPIIYVQQGRVFEFPKFWPCLIAALKDKQIRVAASIGRMDGDPGEIPSNFLVRGHLPQGQILPHASFVIANGNSAAVLGALTHALPMLLVPAGGEQEDLAENCQRAGVAVVVPAHEMDVNKMLSAVDLLLASDRHQIRARQIQQEFIQAGGHTALVNLLERLVL